MDVPTNFFDRHERFLETSTIGTRTRDGGHSPRLARRWDAIVAPNLHLFRDARVLDIACHDGRWTLAAIDVGAKHVTGVELRGKPLRAAAANFAHYQVPEDKYTFIEGDIFEVFNTFEPGQFDLILNLGLLYHITRQAEMFQQMHRLEPKAIILDSRVDKSDAPTVRFKVQGRGTSVAGIPSHGFFVQMCEIYKYKWRTFDWSQFADQPQNLKAYLSGSRATYVLEPLAEAAGEDAPKAEEPSASAAASEEAVPKAEDLNASATASEDAAPKTEDPSANAAA